MTTSNKPRATSVRQQKRRPTGGRLYVMKLAATADLSAAFTGLKLPRGAEVMISSKAPKSLERIRRDAKDTFAEPKPYAAPKQTVSGITVEYFAPDARARAMLRGAEIAKGVLRAAGGAFDLKQVQSLLNGISRQAVDKRVSEGSLIAVPGPNNRRSYPTVQFDNHGRLIEGLRDVVAALPTRNAWSVLHFLVTPDTRLNGEKPIDVLKSGKIESVVNAARRMGEQGA